MPSRNFGSVETLGKRTNSFSFSTGSNIRPPWRNSPPRANRKVTWSGLSPSRDGSSSQCQTAFANHAPRLLPPPFVLLVDRQHLRHQRLEIGDAFFIGRV